jgi:hypothetical protein
MMRKISLSVLLVLSTCLPARAQTELERFDRQLEQIRRDTTSLPSNVPAGQRALFDYGAFIGFNYFSIDDINGDSHGLRQYDFFPYMRLSLDGSEVYLRGRLGYRDWNSGQSLDGRGDQPIDPDLDRGYYRFDLRDYEFAREHRDIGYDIAIKAGRDLAYWGNGLVLSQVLDGIAANIDSGGVGGQIIAGVTPVRTVDIDPSRPNFDHNTRRGFYGGLLSGTLGTQRPFAYGLVQRDYNEDDLRTDVSPSGADISTKFEYDSYYIGVGTTGSITDKLLLGVELAYEGGQGLSNSYTTATSGPSFPGGPPSTTIVPVEQTRDDIQAMAFDARLDYLLNDLRRTRFTLEGIVATGDDDRLASSNSIFGGNSSGTSDRAFNGFGLLNSGLAFAPAISNVLIFRAGALTFPLPETAPFKRMQAGVDLFMFNKLAEHAPIDEASSDSRYLGVEPDLFINWQITSDITIAFRYGIFFPGQGILSNDEPRQFIGAGVTYAF